VLTLKAYLLSTRMKEEGIRKDVGHSISEAWTLCVQEGLPIDPNLPDWAAKLGWLAPDACRRRIH
jgi:hypothetical protein